MVGLATMDMFKTHFELEPGQMQSIHATVALPWSFKIVYGLISDNVPICGSRRKSYLIIFSFLQFISMIVLGFAHLESP